MVRACSARSELANFVAVRDNRPHSCLPFSTVTWRPGKHVQFGEIVDGEEVLELIEHTKTISAENSKPAVPVIVADCGILALE